jgi:hypothetical protein
MHNLIRKPVLILIIVLTACTPKATPTSTAVSPTLQPATPTETSSFVPANWHDMIYHKKVGQVVLVNGGPETGKSPADPVELWNWNGSGWSLLSADSNGPRWRNFASIAYNSKRDVLVLYGGLTDEQDFTDTWEWDGETWTKFTVEGPGPREAAGMTYDGERDKVILFGGAQSGKMMNDSWEWDGVQWTNVSREGPTPRFPAGFAYDAAHKNTLLFGGHSFDGQGFTTYADTWIWDGVNWRQITADGPSARDGARAIFIPTADHILLFGGAEIAADVTNLNDTWIWNGTKWEQVNVQGPPARVHSTMAFDEARGVVLMTGGSNGPNSTLGDTWEWDGEVWSCVDECP